MSEKIWKCLDCGHKFTDDEVENYDTELQGDFPHIKEIGLPHCPNCDSMDVE